MVFIEIGTLVSRGLALGTLVQWYDTFLGWRWSRVRFPHVPTQVQFLNVNFVIINNTLEGTFVNITPSYEGNIKYYKHNEYIQIPSKVQVYLIFLQVLYYGPLSSPNIVDFRSALQLSYDHRSVANIDTRFAPNILGQLANALLGARRPKWAPLGKNPRPNFSFSQRVKKINESTILGDRTEIGILQLYCDIISIQGSRSFTLNISSRIGSVSDKCTYETYHYYLY